MNWLCSIRNHCGVWHYFQRRRALRVLRHARFWIDRDNDAVHILIEKMIELGGY